MNNFGNQAIIFTLLISFCSFSSAQNPQNARKHIESVAMDEIDFSLEKISVCSQYGCQKIAEVSIDDMTWAKITERFEIAVMTPVNERILLAEYIADIEQYIGRKTNTRFDVGGTFNVYLKSSYAKSDQMDCIDESTNTLSYLKLLKIKDKLKSHVIVGLVTRGGLLAGYPHTAVLLMDVTNNEKYVVDSWFFNNGRPAVVLPYNTWKIGWKPD
ncbi:MAG: hypothetical protein AB8B89_04015 [Gammaproteobacteria bacterium]